MSGYGVASQAVPYLLDRCAATFPKTSQLGLLLLSFQGEAEAFVRTQRLTLVCSDRMQRCVAISEYQ